ncbi:MAG: tetratricopeptide repeat protein [Planctomycetes bacterium]|nr:tetratricopeptide repeat protein [Planctomycetota bacterium]
MEQKTEDIDAKNRNLEGRVSTLNEEKNTLSKTCAQMKIKQAALEQDQARLKKKTDSLEVAYKKRANKNKVATASKKQKPVAKKSAIQKSPKTKTSAKPSNKGQKTATKKTSSAKTAKSSPPSHKEPKIPPIEREPVEKYTAERRATTSSKTTESASAEIAPIEREPVEKDTAERRVITMAGDSDVKKINERGIEYGKQGRYDEAIKEFQKVVSIEPDIANVHYNLGLAYKKKGMQPEAEKEFAEYERLSKTGR